MVPQTWYTSLNIPLLTVVNPSQGATLPKSSKGLSTTPSEKTVSVVSKSISDQAENSWQLWGPDATYGTGDEAWTADTKSSAAARTSDLTYDVGVEVFSHLADRNFIIRKVTQAILTYISRNLAWTGVLAVIDAAERTWPEIREFTQLDEEDHGHGGSEVTHALAEVVTTIGHVGFEMLFWGLAGFVDPVAKKKASLGAEPLANLAGVDEHDEFFKDNAIESGGTTMFWIIMSFFYLLNNLT